MPAKTTFNCSTGLHQDVEMAGAELAAYNAQRAIPEPVKKSAIQVVTVEDFRTTDATQATMASWPLALQTFYTARFIVTAIDTANGDCKSWHATASAKRINGGALLVGTPTIVDVDADTGLTGLGVTADANGNNFRVRATGLNGRTFSWSLVGEVVRARPDGLVD
jgi:hypothetical protein